MKSTLYSIVFSLFLILINFSSADEHGRLYYKDLDKSGLQDHLSRLPETTGFKCARGVRLSLNVLFRGGPSNGKNALDYNEKVLSQWQTVDYSYKKIGETTWLKDYDGDFKNYDVRVLFPAKTCPNETIKKYGHIEFYYDGVWYSDFRQLNSPYEYDKVMAKKERNYKRCYSAQSIYRLMPKE
jgi:hypothetical protein